ncbi:MAG: hypothetical protein AAFV53_31125 [Myxococcota bacterium]
MNPAFATFREPHAWLIRGLVEYGYPDVTPDGGRVPPGVFGGLDLSRFSSTSGRDGVTVIIPAVADGDWVQEDGAYSFTVRLTRNDQGQLAFVVRSPDANYIQQFDFDPSQPTYAAGFIHQALQEYVPEFVRWRLQGNEVGWSQRDGLPEFPGEPCSTGLAQFIGGRIRTRQRFDAGPHEGWWIGDAPAPKQMIYATVGRASENIRDEDGQMQAADRAQIIQTVSVPAGALTFLSSLGILQGVLWLLNVPLTLGLYAGGMLNRELTSYLLSLVFSSVLGLGLLIGGIVSVMGARRYRQLRGGIVPWVSMVYTAFAPSMCCLFGLPVSVWAAITWNRPAVVQARGGP